MLNGNEEKLPFAGLVPCVLLLGGLFFIPESPRWLVRHFCWSECYVKCYFLDQMCLWCTSISFHARVVLVGHRKWKFTDVKLQANVGREKEFHASLQKLRGEDADISEEAIEIKVGFCPNWLYILKFITWRRLCSNWYFIQEYIESLRSFPKARLEDLFLSKNIYAVIVRKFSNYLLLEYASLFVH